MTTFRKRGAPQFSLVKPIAKAYLLGLLSSTTPRIAKVLLLVAKGRVDLPAAFSRLRSILREAIAIHRFPTFCGVLVGGSTLLPGLISSLINALLRALRSNSQAANSVLIQRFAHFIATFLSASVSFSLLNRAPYIRPRGASIVKERARTNSNATPGPFDEPPEAPAVKNGKVSVNANILSRLDLPGRTMDLTLFAVIRALDIFISSIWDQTSRASRKRQIVSRATPTLLFCFSVATIMHAWFYSPSRLPHAYNRWISAAADLDNRLMLALRHIRYGTFVYGKDTGMASLLGSLAKDLKLPEELGDPVRTIPIPCELVHQGCGKSCEKHAVSRFCRGWLFAAKMYGPLQLIVLLRNIKAKGRFTRSALIQAILDMARSSAFLGTFIAFFYYGVCLSRTRLGPKVLSHKTVTPQMWDGGLCVLGGCLLCGTSLLVEQQRRHLEILFFVLPRAAATWFPRRYLPENRWKEQVAFATSAAVVLTTVQENPKRVRGVLGTILQSVLRAD